MSRRYVFFAILSLIINLFAACENETVGENKILKYDIESDGITHIVSNGEAKEVARFMVYTDEEEEKILSLVEFALYSDLNQEEEILLDFYNALDNFQFIINGELHEGLYNPVIEYAFGVGLYPMVKISKDNPVEIIVLADINASYSKITGNMTAIKRINISNDKLGSPLPASPNPCLGKSCESSFVSEDPKRIAQAAEIEIINEGLGENCTESEIKLNNGTCVYNQCEIINCHYGDCFMDLESGAAQCDCDDGYTNWEGSNFISCEERLGRFDIESTSELNDVSNGQEVLLAEWDIFLNDAEDANFTNINIHISGDKDSFSNFKFSIYNENHFFGGVQNESPYSYDLDDMSISFGVGLVASNSFPLYKNSVTRIGLYATVNGQSGAQITAAISAAGIFSRDVFYESALVGSGIPLQADNRLGDDFVQSSIAGSGYTYQINPLIRIQ